MRRVTLLAAAFLVLAFFGLVVSIRLAPSDPAVWHVDPLTASGSGEYNEFRTLPETVETSRDAEVSSVYPVPAPVLAAEFDAVAMAAPRTRRLGGEPEDLWMTYVARSRVMGFPDYISVRAIPVGAERSTLAVYSRSRFGRSDFGMNAARVHGWLASLEQRVGGA